MIVLLEWEAAKIFALGQFFCFEFHMNDREWSAYQILQLSLSRGAAVPTFYCCSAASSRRMLQHSLLSPGKRYGPTARYFYQCPSWDEFFSTAGSSCLIKSLCFSLRWFFSQDWSWQSAAPPLSPAHFKSHLKIPHTFSNNILTRYSEFQSIDNQFGGFQPAAWDRRRLALRL